MVQSKAKTVSEYLAGLSKDQRPIVEALREVVRANLDPVFTERMQYGMVGWSVPHSVYPAGYHCDPEQPLPYLCLAAQKNYVALHLFCIYIDEGEVERFQTAWKRTGKKLDMGKACVRFKKLEDVALDVVGDTIRRMDAKRFIAAYEKVLGARKPAARKKAARKGATPEGAAKKAPVRKAAPEARASTAGRSSKKKAAKKRS